MYYSINILCLYLILVSPPIGGLQSFAVRTAVLSAEDSNPLPRGLVRTNYVLNDSRGDGCERKNGAQRSFCANVIARSDNLVGYKVHTIVAKG
jgi:hypothetical protein